MGNREALLDAATLCIFEKGYSRTTARDVASTAGTSLAAIGYHFGSMEKLMAAAMINGMSTWGDASDEALAEVPGADQSRAARFDAFWTHVISSLPEQRPMWVASFEAFTMIERMPELRAHIAEAIGQVRLDFAHQFSRPEDADDDAAAHAIGSVTYALMVGVLTQWLVDPDSAPSATDLQAGLRGLVAGLDTPDEPTSTVSTGSRPA